MLDGLSKIDEIIEAAKKYDMESIALTDHGNLYGAIEFYKAAKEADIKPILGMEAYFTPNGMEKKRGSADRTRHHLILLAKNNEGWQNLIKLSSEAHLNGFYYKPRIDKEVLEDHSEGLICLSGCASGHVPTLVGEGKMEEAKKEARWYKDLFGDDYYIELQPHSPELHEGLKEIAEDLNIPVVATADSHYIDPSDQEAHEILLAVQTGNTIYDNNRMSLEEFNLSLRSPEEMESEFEDTPEAIENTNKIAKKCEVDIEMGEDKIPQFDTPEGQSSKEYLDNLIEERIGNRYEEVTDDVKERIEYELGIINKMGFEDYFLIVQDLVNWAKKRGIVVGPGRGSAAGSIISYILGITNVDPLKYGLLFERFLNPERIQMPDIDIDFADARREEVMAYVRNKYGEDHVAQIITFGKMKARAAIRDTGRALGLPYGLCDEIAKLIPFQATIDEAMDQVDELKRKYENDEEIRELIDSAKKLEGCVRHASVHACGVVIATDPITKYVPLQQAPQGDDAIITQFEMHSVEDLGLLKMDFLGLKNLTIIEEAINLVEEQHGDQIDIENIPMDDESTFKLLQKGQTTGVFQLESSGMKRNLRKLHPTKFEDIDAMIALYRPGPMDLIPQFIRRKHGEEEVTYIHEKLEPILGETYGVGVYQEQMMKIAQDLAGFSLGEADVLRKAIGKKIEELLDKLKDKLIDGMIENGIEPDKAKEIWELFPPFARYGFNRSHSVSYAMISYQTAYLKANYPVELMCALLKTSATNIDNVTKFVKEANEMGIEVLPPDINESMKNFSINDDGENIRFGLLAIKGIGENIAEQIIEERAQGGKFKDLTNFLTRVNDKDLNKKSLESLVKCGALENLGISRGKALENLEEIVKFAQASRKQAQSDQGNLFGQKSTGSIKLKDANDVENNKKLRWEKKLLGLYLTDHPFSKYHKKFGDKIIPIEEILGHDKDTDYPHEPVIGGIITNIKKIQTKKGNPMLFVTLEDNTENMEILVFADTLKKSRNVWSEGKPVIMTGRLSFRDEETKLICNQIKALRK